LSYNTGDISSFLFRVEVLGEVLVTFEDKNRLEVPKNFKGRLAYSDFGNF